MAFGAVANIQLGAQFPLLGSTAALHRRQRDNFTGVFHFRWFGDCSTPQFKGDDAPFVPVLVCCSTRKVLLTCCAAQAGHDSHVLFATHGVGHGARHHAGTGIDTVQLLTGCSIQYRKLSSPAALKNQAGRTGHQAAPVPGSKQLPDPLPRSFHFPGEFLRHRVPGPDKSPNGCIRLSFGQFLQRRESLGGLPVKTPFTAHWEYIIRREVKTPLLIFKWLVRHDPDGAGLDDRDVYQTGFRVECHGLPVVPAGRAGEHQFGLMEILALSRFYRLACLFVDMSSPGDGHVGFR